MGEVVLIGSADQAGRALQNRLDRYRNLTDSYIIIYYIIYHADACLAKLSTHIAIVTDEL